MKVAGTAATPARPELAGQLTLGAGCIGACLLVAYVDPFHFVVQAQSIGDRIQAVTHDSVNPLDSSLCEPSNQLICNSMWCHRFNPPVKSRCCYVEFDLIRGGNGRNKPVTESASISLRVEGVRRFPSREERSSPKSPPHNMQSRTSRPSENDGSNLPSSQTLFPHEWRRSDPGKLSMRKPGN